MRTFITSAVILLALVAVTAPAQEIPKPAGAEKEHKWLAQITGEWDTEAEAIFGPGEQSFKCKGTAKIRTIGELWLVNETKTEMMGQTMTGLMTLGYDATKKKYVGTWVDSMQNHMWHYTGTTDEAGKQLTLDAKGPSFTKPGETSNYRDAIEIKDKDHFILKSSMQGDDGNWTEFMTMNFRRKG